MRGQPGRNLTEGIGRRADSGGGHILIASGSKHPTIEIQRVLCHNHDCTSDYLALLPKSAITHKSSTKLLIFIIFTCRDPEVNGSNPNPLASTNLSIIYALWIRTARPFAHAH